MDQSEDNRKKDIVKRFVAACEDPSHEHKLQLHHRKNRKDHLASMRKGSIKTVSSKINTEALDLLKQKILS